MKREGSGWGLGFAPPESCYGFRWQEGIGWGVGFAPGGVVGSGFSTFFGGVTRHVGIAFTLATNRWGSRWIDDAKRNGGGFWGGWKTHFLFPAARRGFRFLCIPASELDLSKTWSLSPLEKKVGREVNSQLNTIVFVVPSIFLGGKD